MVDPQHQQRVNAVSVLATSHDRGALEEAAGLLASSGDPAFLARLSELLTTREGLARLDDLDRPSSKTFHLSRVFKILEQHPSRATAELCLRLISEPSFLADDDRKIHVLPALAAVRPMTEEAVQVFRRTNAEGYYSLNAPLLVRNGDALALALFEEMIRDQEVPADRRVDALHSAVLAYRTVLAVLRAMDHLLAGNLEHGVAIGVIETVFDYRPGDWFATAKFQPTPPRWESASSEALRFVLTLAEKIKGRFSEPVSLREAIDDTVAHIQAILLVRP